MPIAVFTDHTGEVSTSWDAQVRRTDRDQWKFDPNLTPIRTWEGWNLGGLSGDWWRS